MKTRHIVFTAIIFVPIMLITGYIVNGKDIDGDRIISCIIQGIIFSIIFAYVMNKTMKNMRKKLKEKLNEEDVDFGKPLIARDLMNHYRGITADGGFGYLLSDSLVFVPHKLFMFNTPSAITIMLSDIRKVSDYKVLGLFDTGLKITLKSGKVEKFVIDKESDLYKKIATKCVSV